ncbi:hypothetical protein Q7P36_011224 [Cladosporium allicinum]
MNSPPRIVVYPASEPLTPPATPDRPGGDQTVSNLATESEHKGRQVAQKFDAGLLTPPSISRKTRMKDRQKTPHQQDQPPEEQQQQQQQQHTNPPPQPIFPPTPSEEWQARRLASHLARQTARQKTLSQSPTSTAKLERMRVIREANQAARMAQISSATAQILGDDWKAVYALQKAPKALTFAEVFGDRKRDRERDFGRSLGTRPGTGVARPASASAALVAPLDFGCPPGEGWLARREWVEILMRRGEVWGDGRDVGEEGEEGGGEGEGEGVGEGEIGT